MSAETSDSNVLVMGLGNLLMRDDGVGVHAVKALGAEVPPLRAAVLDVGTAVWHALDFIKGAPRLLALDAVRAGGPPGTVYSLDGYEVDKGRAAASLHSTGLRFALDLLAPGDRPAEFRLLGVEPDVVDFGTDLSPAVSAALPHLLSEARRVLAEWMTKTERE